MEANTDKEYNIDYSIILTYYSMEDLQERFGVWLSEAKRFLEKKGLTDHTRIDKRRLGFAVLDYFMDIIRMKEFHEIAHANLNKIYAYESYWFLRRQPIQIIKEIKDEDLYINEIFVVNNLVAKIRNKCCNEQILRKESMLEMAHLWLYNFKYRVFTAQSLEVSICVFFTANGNRSSQK